jgi:hypothetical protein
MNGALDLFVNLAENRVAEPPFGIQAFSFYSAGSIRKRRGPCNRGGQLVYTRPDARANQPLEMAGSVRLFTGH